MKTVVFIVGICLQASIRPTASEHKKYFKIIYSEGFFTRWCSVKHNFAIPKILVHCYQYTIRIEWNKIQSESLKVIQAWMRFLSIITSLKCQVQTNILRIVPLPTVHRHQVASSSTTFVVLIFAATELQPANNIGTSSVDVANDGANKNNYQSIGFHRWLFLCNKSQVKFF